ncbi:MAG: hypothetical protein HYX89_05835 [Chloroflexi bacterium]|nr:hypothetical protein [Chloroflexota bacterium]
MSTGDRVKVAGLVIRRQRPYTATGIVFLTLEDEFGHIPLVVWPKVCERYRSVIKEPVLVVEGFVSRRDGTLNVVMKHAQAIALQTTTPRSKDWG